MERAAIGTLLRARAGRSKKRQKQKPGDASDSVT